jgi:serine/threonine protein kinase/tetratricopeptide (TPR) repeat protein
MIGKTLGHYRIERALGEGGMGVVYRARDLRLDRPVALKRIRAERTDQALRERFWREARTAASFNHPNIGHLYEIGEDGGELFIAMELLEGETLAQRLARGPLPAGEVVRIGLEVLSALAAIHARGFVHRDVKPPNVFLTSDDRVKLLDFGLVLPAPAPGAGGSPSLTQTGAVVGSPRFMAPEQIRGAAVDGRADLFALGAVLHEAVTGRPLFAGATPVETMYAVLNARAPRLGGSPALDALGAALDRALAKDREARHADAAGLAEALLAVPVRTETGPRVAPVEKVVRLAVLPFRLLRPDPDREFLCASLADAIAMSLAGIRSLVVRSTLASARFDSPTPDLREAAATLEVDALLVGTLLPSGERTRVAAQLVGAPGGEMLWSQSFDVVGRDMFQIQDAITRRIVESMQLPLSAHERGALGRDVPANAMAYELFLRANRLGVGGREGLVARDLYRQALESDPRFAPAWARLGRCHRTIGKYDPVARDENYRRAESALERALALHPDLPSAQYYTAQLELDRGHAPQAIDRLLRVVDANPNDPNGYAGLVAAFRYLGLLEESRAAHRRARALDPEIATSIHYTLLSLGEPNGGELARSPDSVMAADGWVLAQVGREAEALERLHRAEELGRGHLSGIIARLHRSAIEGDARAARTAAEALVGFPDPEGVYMHGSALARVGERALAVDSLVRALDGGYANTALVERDRWLGSVRDERRLREAVARAEARHRAAVPAYGGKVR